MGRKTCLALVLAIFWSSVPAADLPRALPEDVGFSAERLDYMDKFYADKVNKGEMAGIVILVARHGKIVHFNAVGYSDAAKKQKMETDAIFRLHSMTKPIAAAALMILYEEGRFQLTDPLSKYIPEFANLRVRRNPDAALDDTVPLDRAPTVQDALRHTAGLDDIDFGLDVPLAEQMIRLSKIPLRYQPGTIWAYSVSPDIQARLVEVLSGMSFDEFLQKRLFTPLGMKDTSFRVPDIKAKRLATVHWLKDATLTPLDEAHGSPKGVDPAVENHYLAEHKYKGGSTGLVSTAADYWRFAQMMLDGGEFNGTRVLGPRVVRYMARDHLGPLSVQFPGLDLKGIGFGLGFGVIRDAPSSGAMASEGTFYWAGAADTDFWIDPKEDLVCVTMAQQLNLSAPDVIHVRAEHRALVYSALMD